MLGMRNATKNASVTGPAPKPRATTMSRTNPRTRLTRVAPAIPPRARTTCPSLALTLKFPRRYGMMHGVPDDESSESKERSRGEYEVGDEAHTAERAAPSAQPGDALEDPRVGEDGPRRGGRRAPGGDPRSHPRARQGREQGRDSPQYRRAQEVRARASARPRVAPIPPASPCRFAAVAGSPAVSTDDAAERRAARRARPLGQSVEQLERGVREARSGLRAIEGGAGDVALARGRLGAHEVAEIIVRQSRQEGRAEDAAQLALDRQAERRLQLARNRDPGRVAHRGAEQLGL